MLTATEEAIVICVANSTVSRARRDPQHPIYGEQGRIIHHGKTVIAQAPEDEIVEYWKTRHNVRKAGRPRKHPPMPDGWTKYQWRAFTEHVLDGRPLTNYIHTILVERDVIDDDGKLTSLGEKLFNGETN